MATLGVLSAGALPQGAAGEERQEARVVVPSFLAVGGVEEGVATVLTEILLDGLLNRHGIRAIGPQDLKDLLSAEQQRALMGCSDEGCMAQIAGALGARLLIAGQVGRLGTLHVLTLKLIDSEEGKVLRRATLKVARLEEAADAMLPLTDQLLGEAPKVAATVQAFEAPAPPVTREALDPRVFCKRVLTYLERLEKPPYDDAMVAERQALLEDLLITAFEREFNEKRGCYWERQHWHTVGLGRARTRAASASEARDAGRRLAEAIEMARNVEVLQEAWTTGLEKEKNGAGRRPQALPFAVRPGLLSEVPTGEAAQRFMKAWEAAQEVTAKALEAARQKRQAAFEALYGPEDPRRSRTSPNHVFDRIAGMAADGNRLDPCPIWILSGHEIAERVAHFEKEGEVLGCMRRIKDDWVDTDDLRLRLFGGRWRIDRW